MSRVFNLPTNRLFYKRYLNHNTYDTMVIVVEEFVELVLLLLYKSEYDHFRQFWGRL